MTMPLKINSNLLRMGGNTLIIIIFCQKLTVCESLKIFSHPQHNDRHVLMSFLVFWFEFLLVLVLVLTLLVALKQCFPSFCNCWENMSLLRDCQKVVSTSNKLFIFLLFCTSAGFIVSCKKVLIKLKLISNVFVTTHLLFNC